jgi:cytosine/uracil/thiamine/allantoin permease
MYYFSNQTWYTGAYVKTHPHIGDIGFAVGFVVAFVIYYLLFPVGARHERASQAAVEAQQ